MEITEVIDTFIRLLSSLLPSDIVTNVSIDEDVRFYALEDTQKIIVLNNNHCILINCRVLFQQLNIPKNSVVKHYVVTCMLLKADLGQCDITIKEREHSLPFSNIVASSNFAMNVSVSDVSVLIERFTSYILQLPEYINSTGGSQK